MAVTSTQVPSPNSPLVDPGTGFITPTWFYVFQRLVARTGGNAGTSFMPVTGGTFTGPVTMGANQLSGSNLVFSGGSLDGVTIGGSAPAVGSFTSLSASGSVSGAGFVSLLAPYAPLSSPALVGSPTAPTATAGTNTTQIATTAFVQGAVTTSTNDIGRNKLHNAQFRIQQRGVGAFTATGAYTADRWLIQNVLDSQSVTIPAIGDAGRSQIGDEEAQFGLQNVFTGNAGATAFNAVQQRIEDVYRLSNRTVTVSFWAKAASGTPKLGVSINQNFGSGGSATVSGTGQSVTLSTTWTRYSLQFSIASASGKTVGSSSYSAVTFWYSSGANNSTFAGAIGVQSATIALWGTQLELGNETQFEKDDLPVDWENCQRFFFSTFGNGVAPAQNAGADTGNVNFPATSAAATAQRGPTFIFPTQMRASPTVTLYNTQAANAQIRDQTAAADCSGAAMAVSDHAIRLTCTGAAGTAVGNLLAVHLTASADL